MDNNTIIRSNEPKTSKSKHVHRVWCRLPIPDGQRYKDRDLCTDKTCQECYQEWWENFRESNKT